MNVLDELRTGEKVAEGRFRVDQQRALEKLRKNRLANPADWVKDVLRAAHASGAKLIEARTDADDVELFFDGRPFPAAVMKNLLAQALGSDETHDSEPRYRLFALGIAGALGVGLKRLHVHSGKVALDVDAAGNVELRETDARVRTAVKARKKLGLGVAAALLFGKKPEAQNIRFGAFWLDAAVRLDGKEQIKLTRSKQLHDDGTLALFAKPYELDFSRVTLVSHGVQAGLRYWTLPGVQLDAVVFCDSFRSNASGSDVVDTDPQLEKALAACRKASLALLQEHVLEPSPALREQLATRLLRDDKLDSKVREVLGSMPLFPGPSGERWSLSALEGHARRSGSLYVATQAYPKGSYPEHTVLFDADTRRWEELLPAGKRVDVDDIVRRNRRVAENKARWETQAPEPASLDARDWLARTPIATPKLKGEVGLLARGDGAWVRLLAKGRFVQEGEVPLLAPLRLRAVVDVQGSISDKLWAELPTPKLWSTVVDEVQAAAEAAVGLALSGPDAQAAFAHARDVLLRRAADKGKGLPKAVTKAPLFECLAGARCSLDDLRSEERWRFVTRRFDDPALDGRRVLVLDDPAEKQRLEPYANGRLTDVTGQLEREREVRRRLAGPKQKPVVLGGLVTAPFSRGALHGEVAISDDASDKLDLVLLRDGFELERTTQTARYGPARAAVESAALKPNADWSKAVRDAAFDEALKAAHDAEAQLLVPLLDKFPSFGAMPAAGKAWLLAFAKKELGGPHDAVVNALLDAKLLDGPKGPVSLAELKALATRRGHLYLLPSWRPAEDLAGEACVSGDEDVEALLHLGTGLEPEDGMPVLERAAALAEFSKRAPHERELGPSSALYVEVDGAPFRGGAALALAWEPLARASLLVDGRLWKSESVPSALPLDLELHVDGVSPLDPLDGALRQKLGSLVVRAQARVLERALDEGHRRAAFAALGEHLERSLAAPLARRLLDLPLFPCTDGAERSAAALAGLGTVKYVTKRLAGSPRSGAPVVLALDAGVTAGLARFAREDVTETLELELGARDQHSRKPVAEQIQLSSAALLKRAVFGAVAGEVALAPAAEGRLELFYERRPLCAVPAALPMPLAAAVNCERINPSPTLDGVLRDAAFQKVVDAVVNEAGALGDELARRWDELKAHPAALEAALRLCALFAGQRGKKRDGHPLLELPLLTATDGRPLTVRWLLDAGAGTRGKVAWSERAGALLDDRWVWRATREQRAWLAPLDLALADVSEELERADRVRARPKVSDLKAPLESGWRERFDAGGIAGEVALPEAPTEALEVELYHERALLERYATDHVFGGVAAVNCDALKPNASWTKAARNGAFKSVMVEVEKALERVLARRLQHLDRSWWHWAENAVLWAAGQAGPVGEAVLELQMFETLAGERVTVGAVLAEYARTRCIAVADPRAGPAPAGRLVLKDTAQAQKLLGALRVTVKGVTDELMRQAEQAAQRRARKLPQASWVGDALVRVKVNGPGVTGELALPAGDPNVEVTLAKQGTRVQALTRRLAPEVAGVVDIEDLLVNEAWTEARLAPPERELIEKTVDELLGALCRAVPSMARERRAGARRHVLVWVTRAGVTQAAHLDRLTGAHADLARAPVFETAAGEWTSLAVLADEVSRRGQLAVFAKSWLKPDTGGVLGLWVPSHDEPWLDRLEAVLGPGSLERVKDARLWREKLSEEDPLPGSPEAWSLGRLRRDVRLLRAGALGALSADDVDDLRLKSLGGAAAVRYDARRRVVLLDVDHAQVKRALAEGKLRRERLYVLLAAIYGAINRALDRITDEHEASLALALATHLAENPQLLEPGES